MKTIAELKALINTIQKDTPPVADNMREILNGLLERIEALEEKCS